MTTRQNIVQLFLAFLRFRGFNNLNNGAPFEFGVGYGYGSVNNSDKIRMLK